MLRYHGGERTKSGFYWSARTWAITMVERQGGTLPGDATERYVRIPVLVMLLAAPIMGAGYVMFLPFIGFAMVLDFLARRAVRGARAGTLALAAVVSPRWRPGEAYLAEDEKEEAEQAGEKTDDAHESGSNAECAVQPPDVSRRG